MALTPAERKRLSRASQSAEKKEEEKKLNCARIKQNREGKMKHSESVFEKIPLEQEHEQSPKTEKRAAQTDDQSQFDNIKKEHQMKNIRSKENGKECFTQNLEAESGLDQSFDNAESANKDEVASFIASSLQDIITSSEFEDVPKVVKRQIKHLNFLLHLLLKFQDFLLIHKYHLDVVEDIRNEKTSWSDDLYFKLKEESVELELTDVEMFCKVEQNDVEEVNNEDSFLTDDFPAFEENHEKEIKTKMKKPKAKSMTKKIKLKISKKEKLDEELTKTEVWCPECNENVLISGSLTKHMNRVHKQKLSCPYCSRQFYSEKRLHIHMKKRHSKIESDHLCSKCGNISVDIDSYIKHIQSHNVPVQCYICQKPFGNIHNMKAHIKNFHDRANEPKQVCPYCGNFYKVQFLPTHIRIQHTETQTIVCSMCDYTSNVKSQLDNHYKRVHVSGGVTCPTCGKLVKQLKQHIKRGCITSVIEKKFDCDQCEKKFKDSQQLKRHINNVHLNIKDKECPHCNYKTTTGFNLKIHITRVHEGKKLKSECEFCQKQVYSLEWHITRYHPQEMAQQAEKLNPLTEESAQNITMKPLPPQGYHSPTIEQDIKYRPILEETKYQPIP